MEFDFIREHVNPDKTTKIVLLVLDGLGGLPMNPGGLTELEAASTPNLDALAAQSICGLHEPVETGITPGSGPAHLGLFGYDPIKYQIGRGVLSALGIGFDLQEADVAARGNFCTLDAEGRVADRRAGRISTEKSEELIGLLDQIELPNVEIFLEPVKDYRVLLVLRGENLGGDLSDTDPQETGVPPLEPQSRSPSSDETGRLVEEFLNQTREVLADQKPANMILLRGFSKLPDWPTLPQIYRLKAAAIAVYPMYRGVARLVGMEPLESDGTLDGEFKTLEEHWEDFDYFFVHVKPTDSAGEDGDFERKVKYIEETDAQIPRLLDLEPDVLIVTGDHSTPAKMKYHSWHPVPVLLWSKYCRPDGVKVFGERACISGGLGPRIPVIDLMPLAMAHARRLEKFGA
ncbi:MAG: 2,3-bisphosphoglycerate-independent phosphoglycerate mutase [Chloroflexota bacterium]|nr:2,3-bisphosphoglycerate-independent phosphoglycerate mutase [Chloroflexota bacterium]